MQYHPKVAHFLEAYGIILVVIVMMAVLALIKPAVFLSAENLTNILKQNASLALLALGMLVVIITGGIDLSVGSVMALAMVCIALSAQAGWPWPIGILIGPIVGIAAGVVNGLGLTWLRLPHPFIITLGTLNIARGLTYLLTGGAPVSGLARRSATLASPTGISESSSHRPVCPRASSSSRSPPSACGSF
jgi:ribose/xylose/arabinose/galactoside ABC-type transport system permease subunit